MAVENNVTFSASTDHGRIVRDMLNVNEDADDRLADTRDMLVQMLTGASNADASFDVVVKRLKVDGYDPTQGAPTAGQLTKARSLFDQIDIAYAKRSGSVSGVQAARDQMYSFLRG